MGKPATPKPGQNLFLHALYMVTVGVFNTASTVNPAWRKNLSQPYTAYAVSSLFYTAAGLLTLAQTILCPGACSPGWPPGWAQPEAILVILQGFWSYWSDVAAIGTTSIAHPIDRFSAVCLTFFQFYKFGVMCAPHMGVVDAAWTSTTLALAIVCKMFDYRSMQANDIAFYRRSHFWWHVSLPFGFGSYVIYVWARCTKCF